MFGTALCFAVITTKREFSKTFVMAPKGGRFSKIEIQPLTYFGLFMYDRKLKEFRKGTNDIEGNSCALCDTVFSQNNDFVKQLNL